MWTPNRIAEQILYEDDAIIVINKPAGLMVEPDRNGYPNLQQEVKKYLKHSSPTRTEVYAQHIHRLDRPVSGVVLIAKQRTVLKHLSEQFAERKVKKEYLALTDHAPALHSGELAHWHRKEKKKAILYATEIPYSEKAVLNFNVQPQNTDSYLWQIELHTGKYHQIRAQLAQVGCPILGDAMYGSTNRYHENQIALHAWKLTFSHPLSNRIMPIEAPCTFLRQSEK